MESMFQFKSIQVECSQLWHMHFVFELENYWEILSNDKRSSALEISNKQYIGTSENAPGLLSWQYQKVDAVIAKIGLEIR